MTVKLEHELLRHIVSQFEERIMIGRGGRVDPRLYAREGRRKVLIPAAGMMGASCAYLALTPVEGNPYHGREDLLTLAMDAGDRLVLDHAAVGRGGGKPNHFTIFPLVTLYELAAEHAGKARRGRWERTLARNLRATLDLVTRSWDVLGRGAPWAGTGPNHYFGWLSVGYGTARALQDEPAAARLARAMRRHARLQAPGGYFPEHRGPAVVYHRVSLGGLAEFHRLKPSAATLRAIDRGVRFLVRALYPDLRTLATFDERNRLGGKVDLHHALPWTAEGRGLLARVLERARTSRSRARAGRKATPFGGGGQLAGNFRCYQHAAAAAGQVGRALRPLPSGRRRFVWKLEDEGLVRKEGPWFYALSAWAHPARPGNPYHLERTEACSVYHDRAGLIIGGGNDKRAPYAATVHILEGGEVHYFPPIGGALAVGARPRVLSGRRRCDRLELDYGAARAALELRAESPKRLLIGLAMHTEMTDPEFTLVLQLPLRAPVTLESGPRKLRLLPADAHTTRETVTVAHRLERPGFTLGRSLRLPGQWTLDLPPGAKLLWPHVPWNGYRPPDYRDTPDRAVALLRVPAPAPDYRAEVRVRVE